HSSVCSYPAWCGTPLGYGLPAKSVQSTGRGACPFSTPPGSYRLRVETNPRFGTNFSLGISNSDEDFHFVLLAGQEIHGKIGDIPGFETDHLHPFVIRKI